MADFTPTELNQTVVKKGRKIDLPPLLAELKQFDHLVFAKVEGGYLLRKVDAATTGIKKKVLYAIEIGQCAGNMRWYGIVIDEFGLIKFRHRSSTEAYLRKDLTELTDSRMREKLDEKMGVGQWQHPIFINLNEIIHLPAEVVKVINKLRLGLANGTWPPTRQDTEYDS